MEKKTTNQDILRTLQQINQGKSTVNQLVFDPTTGEFLVASPDTQVSPDATTINQIAQDGFANQPIWNQ